MSSGQKIAVSVLSTVLLFAAFTVAAFAGLFSVIDARFYEPAKINEINKQLDNVAVSYDKYIDTLAERFGLGSSSFLSREDVTSYIENSPAEEKVRSRTNAAGNLFAETPGLSGIRLVDSNGTNVHFSTYRSDILRQTTGLVAYKNYTEALTPSGYAELPYNDIYAPDTLMSNSDKYKLFFDGRDDRIIFAFPFYDTYSAYRGTMFFYVNVQDFNRVLLSQNAITIGGTGLLVSDTSLLVDKVGSVSEAELSGSEGETFESTGKSGFVFGIPAVGRTLFEGEILKRWKIDLTKAERIVSMDSSGNPSEALNEQHYWVLLSSNKSKYGFVSGVYRDETFSMPEAVKILLLICIFTTLFLIMFLIFSMKTDDMVVIRSRILKFQFAFVNEYLKKKEDVDWNTVAGNIAGRKDAVSNEIIKSLGKKGLKHEKDVKQLLDRSWEDIINAVKGQGATAIGAAASGSTQENTAEIKKMLEDILSNGTIKVQAIQSPAAVQPANAAPVSKPTMSKPVDTATAEPVEDLEEVEELDEVESAEPVEEIADAEPVEDLEEVEELDEVESAEPVEEIADAEPVEDLEEVEELDEVESAEPVEEIADAEPVEDLEEVEELDEVESAEPVEELSEAEPVEDLEEVEELDSVTDSEPLTKKQEKEQHKVEKEIEDLIGKDIVLGNHKFEESLKEDIGFGEPPRRVFKVDEDDTIIDTFATQSLDFSDLDRLDTRQIENGKKESANKENDTIAKAVVNENIETLKTDLDDDISDLEVLEKERNSMPFSFTQFAANNNGVTDLEEGENVILEDSSGVFYIKNNLETTTVAQDSMFKKLVDSVLK